jgi:hypothetical protein
MFPPAANSTRKLLTAPATCDKEPKFVLPFTIPVIVAVPGVPAVRRMFPLAGKFAPLTART